MKLSEVAIASSCSDFCQTTTIRHGRATTLIRNRQAQRACRAEGTNETVIGQTGWGKVDLVSKSHRGIAAERRPESNSLEQPVEDLNGTAGRARDLPGPEKRECSLDAVLDKSS